MNFKSMSKIKKALISSVLCGMLFNSYSGMAQGTPEKMHHMQGAFQHESGPQMKRHFKKMAKYLELTEEQKTQMKAIRAEAKTQRSEFKESMSGFHQQVKALMQAETFDEQAFSVLQSQYQGNFQHMALIKAKTKHAMFQVLTSEQQEKMQEFKEKRGKRKG